MVVKRVAVTGAGGFIGHHLVRALKKKGYWVRGIDIKKPEFSPSDADEFWFADLRDREVARKVLKDVEAIYALAADVGGVGHLSRWNYEIIKNNLEINTNTLQAALDINARLLFTSSACVYPLYRQKLDLPEALKEEDVDPADPEGAYGWEKLTTEKMLLHAAQDKGAQIRIARFQNVYGPEETYAGGKEKVIGALCRKVASASNEGVIEVWGDGKQIRSFCYIDDCTEGLIELMESEYALPLNVSGDESISIQEVAQHLIMLSGKKVTIKNIPGPVGVRGRQADNTKRKQILKWAPRVSLFEGLAQTYYWVAQDMRTKQRETLNEKPSA